MSTALPKEMQLHTYAIMDRVENDHWWFVGRRRILEQMLFEITAELKKTNSKELRILDVGCGTGANLKMLNNFGQAEGVDVSDEALEYCRLKGLNVKKGLAESLPFEDEVFDITAALDVIEHLDDDSAGLREIYRVTKNGGFALFFVPAFMWLWGVQDDVSNHRIRYTMPQFTERVKKAGFEIHKATYANITFFLPILLGRQLMRLTGIKPESENNLNISLLNGPLGWLFGLERHLLKYTKLPFGVSIIVVGRKSYTQK